MTFIKKMIAKAGGEIRFIKATEQGKPCWFYVRLTPEKYQEYVKSLKTGKMDIVEYGEILESDWGDYPSEDVIRFMKQEYNYETPAAES